MQSNKVCLLVHTRSTFGVKNFASCIKNEIESNGLNVEYYRIT